MKVAEYSGSNKENDFVKNQRTSRALVLDGTQEFPILGVFRLLVIK